MHAIYIPSLMADLHGLCNQNLHIVVEWCLLKLIQSLTDTMFAGLPPTNKANGRTLQGLLKAIGMSLLCFLIYHYAFEQFS